MSYRVECIVKGDNSYSDCRCITEIRTSTNSYTRSEAYDYVDRNPNTLYVERYGSKAYLIPAKRDGVKYVRTEANDTTADNLLNVREC